MARLLQLSPGVAPFDATLSLMLGIVRIFRRQGLYRNYDIAARHVPAGFRIKGQGISGNRVHPLEDLDPRRYSAEDLLIYHHGIACDAEGFIRQFPGSRFIVYHGLTPARFYLPYNLTVAGRLERGRRELQRLASAFERAYCFSRVTEADLRESGYLNIRKVDPPLQDVWTIPGPGPSSPEGLPPLYDQKFDRTMQVRTGKTIPSEEQAEEASSTATSTDTARDTETVTDTKKCLQVIPLSDNGTSFE